MMRFWCCWWLGSRWRGRDDHVDDWSDKGNCSD